MEYEGMTMADLKKLVKEIKKTNDEAKKVFKNVSKMNKGEIVEKLKIHGVAKGFLDHLREGIEHRLRILNGGSLTHKDMKKIVQSDHLLAETYDQHGKRRIPRDWLREVHGINPKEGKINLYGSDPKTWSPYPRE